MTWSNLQAEIADEFEELTYHHAEIQRALEVGKSNRQRYPSKIWWHQKRAARRLMARSKRVCADPNCKRVFTGKRSDSLYCSHACSLRRRARDYQRRKAAAKRRSQHA